MPEPSSSPTLSRRAFLSAGARTALLAGAATPLLAACGDTSAAPSANTSAKLPAYIPHNAAKPALAGTAQGLQPGYFSYPADPVTSVTRTPIKNGGTVAIQVILTGPPPTPEAQNPAWQEIERQVGAKLTLDMVSQADYRTKFETTISSGNLPDLLFYTYNQSVPAIPQFAASRCADLTPHLAGDAVKSYPNLAALPPASWANSVISGKIYGVPVPTQVLSSGYFYHQAMLGDAGARLPTNSDDYASLLKEMTSPKTGHWGFVTQQSVDFCLGFARGMWKVPNDWHVDKNGKFTYYIETPENKEATAYVRDLYQAGVFYPDSIGFTNAQRRATFSAGKAFATIGGFGDYQLLWQAAQTAGQSHPDIRTFVPPGRNGGRGATALGNGYYGITFVKKASTSRVEDLLRLLNYLAAPFGSAEYLLLNYGVQGVDYTRDPSGNPVLTSRGKTDTLVPWGNITQSAPVLYAGTDTDYVKAVHQAEAGDLPLGTADPTDNLYSPTFYSKGPVLQTLVRDTLADLIDGHRPISDYDQFVAQWRSQGGNQIRSEYEKAWHSLHK